MSNSGLMAAVRTEMEARAEGHTPTPYKLSGDVVESLVHVKDSRGRIIADCSMGLPYVLPSKEREKTAAFVVLACNSHDAMQAALLSVEWGAEADLEEGGMASACPYCGQLKTDGHSYDCGLAVALKLSRGERLP